eukprot:4714388-Amphidinium_carterae.2
MTGLWVVCLLKAHNGLSAQCTGIKPVAACASHWAAARLCYQHSGDDPGTGSQLGCAKHLKGLRRRTPKVSANLSNVMTTFCDEILLEDR